jgi:hypothetical protein
VICGLAKNFGIHSETVLCFLFGVMHVVKSTWLGDEQGSEAGQFGAWFCVGKL